MMFSDLTYDVVKDNKDAPTTTTTNADTTTTTTATTSVTKASPVITTSAPVSASSSSSNASSKVTSSNQSLPRRATMLKFASKITKLNIVTLLFLFVPPLLYLLIDK